MNWSDRAVHARQRGEGRRGQARRQITSDRKDGGTAEVWRRCTGRIVRRRPVGRWPAGGPFQGSDDAREKRSCWTRLRNARIAIAHEHRGHPPYVVLIRVVDRWRGAVVGMGSEVAMNERRVAIAVVAGPVHVLGRQQRQRHQADGSRSCDQGVKWPAGTHAGDYGRRLRGQSNEPGRCAPEPTRAPRIP